MGFLTFLFSKPTPELLARMLIAEMQRVGMDGPFTYDKTNDRVVRGTGNSANSINLANFHQDFLNVPRWRRKQFVAGVIQCLNVPEQLPEDFQEAAGHLRPKIWARAGLASMRLMIELDGGDPEKFDAPQYEIGSHLTASLVYDLPNSVRSIGREDLDKWGTSYYEALEIARENLGAEELPLVKIGDGCFVSGCGDSYDASRLLIPSLLEKFEVQGAPIAMVPRRDLLIVCGSEDESGLEVMVKLAREGAQESRPMVPIPLRWEGDAWVDWFPSPGLPSYPGFRELALRYYLQEYESQKEILCQLFEKRQTEVFLASYTLVSKQDDSLFSYAVWVKDVATILPRVEWVCLVSSEETTAMVVWEDLERIVGHLLQPTDHYPPRFQTLGFPTEVELAELGTAEP